MCVVIVYNHSEHLFPEYVVLYLLRIYVKYPAHPFKRYANARKHFQQNENASECLGIKKSSKLF